MIFVLADDFSGAAEMAGIAFRAGLKTKLITDSINLPSNAEVIVIDTNTRSVSKEQARDITDTIMNRVSRLNIDWMYKKVDSVLRGHVVAELNQILDQNYFKRSIIVPANPSIKRTISEGLYFVDGQPLDQTEFANDPEFPAKSAKIVELLAAKNNKYPVLTVKQNDPILDGTINVADTGIVSDMIYWCDQINNDVLPAGGSDFFALLLQRKTDNRKAEERAKRNDVQKLKLYVIGSTAGLQNLEIAGCAYPCLVASANELSSKCRDQWQSDIESHLINGRSVAMWIDEKQSTDKEIPQKIKAVIADIVKNLINTYKISNLIISGGDTAHSIVDIFKWRHFKPVYEYATGVVSLDILDQRGPELTIKPGSYPWPQELVN